MQSAHATIAGNKGLLRQRLHAGVGSSNCLPCTIHQSLVDIKNLHPDTRLSDALDSETAWPGRGFHMRLDGRSHILSSRAQAEAI